MSIKRPIRVAISLLTVLLFTLALVVAVGAQGRVSGAAELATDRAPTVTNPQPSAIGLRSLPFVPEAILYDNGPLVNAPGGGPGGADGSVLQTNLGMSILGFGHALATGFRVADDFAVTDPGGWQVDTITLYAYQTNSPITSTINHVNLRIWDGPPNDPGSTVVFGDTTTNRLVNSVWSNIYRYSDTAPGTTRPVMANTVAISATLPPGDYWLDWQTGGTLASGPWAPPITINGQTTTGNALQFDPTATVWNPALDGGTGTQQGFPFIVEGEVVPFEGPAILLEKTVGTDPSVCATTDAITVTQGSDVTYCYEVTNNGTVTLTNHDLDDSELGTILSNFVFTLTPGSSVFVTDTVSITADTINTATWTAYNPVQYQVLTGTCGLFPDISTTGTALNLDDDAAVDITLPFQFPFYDVISDIATVSNNGVVLIGEPGGFVSFVNEPLPTVAIPHGMAPFWDDIDSETGNVYHGYYTYTLAAGDLLNPSGQAAGNTRYYVVDWHQRSHFPGPSSSTVTFAALMLESGQGLDGYIVFCYQDTTFGDPTLDYGASATIGINQDETNAEQYSFDTPHPELTGTFGIAFRPLSGGESATATDSASVNVLAPEIAVSPASLAETHVTTPTITTRTLTINNVGDGVLDWDIEEAPDTPLPSGRAHVQPVGNPALSSNGPAPLKRQAGQRAPTSPLIELPGGAPAYGIEFFQQIFFSMNTANPSVLNPIASNANALFGGDFLNGDFTREYVVDFDTNQLGYLDTASGAYTPIGTATPSGSHQWSGLAGDNSSGTLYGSATDCNGSTLYTINPTTGAATLVGPVTNVACLIDIAVNAAGEMYGLDIITDSLVRIDKTTGAATVIGSVGFDANFAQGMDFDELSNTLYLAAFNNAAFAAELRTANLSTGATTLIGPLGAGSNTEVDAFAIATGGACGSPADIPWVSVNPISGTTAPAGASDVTVTFDSTGLSTGLYTGNLCVNSNDLDESIVVVPLTLTVGGPTAIDLATLGTTATPSRAALGLLLGALGMVALAGFLVHRRHS